MSRSQVSTVLRVLNLCLLGAYQFGGGRGGGRGGRTRLEELVEQVDGDTRAVRAEHRVVGGRQEARLVHADGDHLRRAQVKNTANVGPLAVECGVQ